MRITGGPLRGRKLLRFGGRQIRPPLERVRQSVFSILEEDIADSRVLDLFAGSGAFGLEALSRGAQEAVFVEVSRRAAEVLGENIRILGLETRATVLVADLMSEVRLSDLFLARSRPRTRLTDEGKAGFDIVFLDPPFEAFNEATSSTVLKNRLGEILTGSLLNVYGRVVFRRPRTLDFNTEFKAADTRIYGRSVVCFFDKLQIK